MAINMIIGSIINGIVIDHISPGVAWSYTII